MGFETLHFVIKIDSAHDIQRLQLGSLLSERFVARQGFGLRKKRISEVDDSLNSVAIRTLGQFQAHHFFLHLSGSSGSRAIGFYYGLIKTHQLSPFKLTS